MERSKTKTKGGLPHQYSQGAGVGGGAGGGGGGRQGGGFTGRVIGIQDVGGVRNLGWALLRGHPAGTGDKEP